MGPNASTRLGSRYARSQPIESCRMQYAALTRSAVSMPQNRVPFGASGSHDNNSETGAKVPLKTVGYSPAQ